MDVIEVENVSKKYFVHRNQPFASDSLKAILANGVKRALNKVIGRAVPLDSSASFSEEFWALKDISLKIQEGDRVAFLGRNGAGKSTLFKLLARITAPTRGCIKIKGRIASLLEVGTGFHPELTGRENIYLNGSIMGMRYNEIRQKFHEIVFFADIEKFLDTPVKRYSSGMLMRLAFAVAAHLDFDILLVDEVLAVGDAQFQEKCLKKISEKSAQGKTTLFVSHSVDTVLALCNKGVLLEQGELKAFEPIEQCVSRYVRSYSSVGFKWTGDLGDDHIRLYHASLRTPSSGSNFFYQNEKTFLDLEFEVLKPQPDLMIGFSVLNSHHLPIARSRLCDHIAYHQLVETCGFHKLSFQIDLDLFHPGEYQIRVECALLNKKKILQDDVSLTFAVYSQSQQFKHEFGVEREGISLGNRWMLKEKEATF